jgi:hypothetical protein
MTIKRNLTILVAAGCLMFFAASVSACMCEGGSQKKAFNHAKKKATVIFVGRAIEVVNGITRGEFLGWRVKLKVDQYWKGQFSQEITVFTGPNDCAAHFAVGDEYLVFAYVPEREDHLYTDVCMRTGLVRYSAADLKWLGKSKRQS